MFWLLIIRFNEKEIGDRNDNNKWLYNYSTWLKLSFNWYIRINDVM